MDVYSERTAAAIRVKHLREELAQAEEKHRDLDELVRIAEKYDLVPKARAASDLLNELIGPSFKASTHTTQYDRVVRGSEAILSDGKRRLSRDLLPELDALGVKVGGKNPKGLIATYLSREPDVFESDTKLGGWALRRLTKKARPNEVSASLGLFLNGSQATHPAGNAVKEDAEIG